MSEEKATYHTGSVLPTSLDAFHQYPCALPYTDEGYQPPGPGEVAQLIKLTGWSQNDAAKIVGVTWNAKKGASTIRKWKTDMSKDNYRPIPYAAWRLMLLCAGVVTVDESLNGIGVHKNAE